MDGTHHNKSSLHNFAGLLQMLRAVRYTQDKGKSMDCAIRGPGLDHNVHYKGHMLSSYQAALQWLCRCSSEQVRASRVAMTCSADLSAARVSVELPSHAHLARCTSAGVILATVITVEICTGTLQLS